MRWWQSPVSRSRFGDAVIVLFLLAQAADGVMTYVGVTTMGAEFEANPILVGLMGSFGHGATVAGAKLVAAALGISLHLIGVHRIIALLTAIYLVGAVFPWMGLFLFGSHLGF
ncbi:MAG: DUF5658 family protein [Acidobacteria bacterium]|nr:DUF5658 family protein [Acidobacteriota bacterium]